MIVTLAGHVDHGKTSLVKALTGVDTDRLAEEKRRGLTIDLGFAYTDIGGRRIGFVDVPGHHRFIHNMVAGVAAHQCALFVVAVDDGPMPQTREHLDILRLLGLTRGVVALTKIDKVPAERLAAADAEVARLIDGTFLRSAPRVPVSTVTEHGLAELETWLSTAADETVTVRLDECFRLAIDRVFTVRGAGLVVTGTVHSGEVTVGDEVKLAPRGESARVRSVRAQDREARDAHPGDRCALNLVGTDGKGIERGMWLVAPESFAPARRIVVRLDVLVGAPRAIRHWLPVHVYHATSHTTAYVALLEGSAVAPGTSAFVELELDHALHPKRGDRLIVRDQAREHTLAGGEVIDVAPPRTGRRKPARIARLVHQGKTLEESFAALLDDGQEGVECEPFRLNWNLSRKRLDTLLERHGVRTLADGARRWAVPNDRIEGLRVRVVERLDAYHKAAPYSAGLRFDQILKLTAAPARLLESALGELENERIVRRSAGHFHILGHRPRLPPADEELLQRLTTLMQQAPQPPSIGDAARTLAVSVAALQQLVGRVAALGLLVRVSDSRCFLPETGAAFVDVAIALSAGPQGFTAAEFRDAAAVGRNLAIEVLEHFDRRGLTRRAGDRRRVVNPRAVL